ncbi:MAG: hypothetical protein GC159_23200 [Phycisphaera sp.]|nr:hypothetical protein [Phycisphaera sp.]
MSGLIFAAASTLAVAREAAFTGVVTGDDVYLRSGPDANYYPVGKLDAGSILQVHREMTGGWLEVSPPPGQFSYIAKDFVKVTSGRDGVVTGDRVRVRAPSPAGPDKSYRRQQYLNKDDKVIILGEQDEYYKIVPPADARLYLKKDFVTQATAQQIAAAGRTPAAPVRPAASNPAASDNNVSLTATANEGRLPVAIREAANNTAATAPAPDTAASTGVADGPTPAAPATPDTPAVAETPATPEPNTDAVGTLDPSRTAGFNTVAVVGADDASAKPSADAITVDVLPGGLFHHAGKTYLVQQAEAVLTEVVKEHPEAELFVRAGKQVPNKFVVSVLQAAKAAGVAGRVAVQTGDTTQIVQVPAKSDTTSADAVTETDAVAPPKELTLADIEAKFKAEMAKPTKEQAIGELRFEYEKLLTSPDLAEADRSLATARVDLLKIRQDLQASLAEIHTFREQIAESQKEAAEALAAKPKNYTAVGRLAASTLYNGERLPRLYRIVDPIEGLTLAYVRTTDDSGDVTRFVGLYVGVIGDKQYDPALKLNIITAKAVDPLKAAPVQSAAAGE